MRVLCRFRRACLLAAALSLPAAAQAADTVVVRQKERLFTPAQVEIKAGGRVTIGNDDPAIHHLYVDAPAMQFDSGEQLPGTEVSIPFANPGRFAVRCAIHPRMRLDVGVTP